MDNDVRELLRDIAEDIPPQRQVPSTLRPRARRRVVATVGMTLVFAVAVLVGGVAVLRSITQASLVPVNPPAVRLPDDPGAWQRIVLPGGAPGCNDHGCLVRTVTAGDAGLVAMGTKFGCCGEAFAGWSSPDGLSWQQIDGDNPPKAAGFAAAGPGFVITGTNGVYTSTDGVSWDHVQPPVDRAEFLGVTAGGPGVVAVGSPDNAWFSSDGATWQPATVPQTGVPADMTRVAAGPDRLVAMGSTRAGGPRSELVIWASSDGMTWHDVAIDNAIMSPSCRITGLAGSPAGFVATGWCGPVGHEGDYLVWRSADGVTWSRVGGALEGQTHYFAVSAGPNGFIGTNSQGVWTSVDGASWTPVPTGSAFQGAEVLNVIAWGSRFVAVGDMKDGHNVVWISGPQH
ncbi:MAG TPA: hypothetical protein VK646_13110 [Actinomycetota bacterium]|nr:hypothetical protein [Actinomycetota bacterium]